MKKSLYILSAFGCFLLFSCENQNENNANESVESSAHDKNHESKKDKHHHEPLALNDGDKWEVNEEMHPHVAAEEELLKNYSASQSTDYMKLADQLVKENSNLINSCTMEGESHEELHKWLHPHMELLDELEQAESNEQADEVISKLDHSFKTFHQYFQ